MVYCDGIERDHMRFLVMPTQQPNWEGVLLAFGGVFTVLLGISYGVSMFFRIPIPWFVILIFCMAPSMNASLYITMMNSASP